ncbi:unnamed protein product [Adineta steineri]|uniref:Uncharacterized protein n=1 Tax=Adineta steineri TaxID=433720 RepID=A0A814SD36_9BILA|nr:unnamed protein product [Adineta steineri]CAF1146435.1 unnamed protein product [Adineta steineri]
MSAPTGMSAGTGLYYNDVAAQMEQYLNNNTGHQLHSARGYAHHPQATHGTAYASHMPSTGTAYATYMPNSRPHYSGINHAMNQDVGVFGRSFMRSLHPR